MSESNRPVSPTSRKFQLLQRRPSYRKIYQEINKKAIKMEDKESDYSTDASSVNFNSESHSPTQQQSHRLSNGPGIPVGAIQLTADAESLRSLGMNHHVMLSGHTAGYPMNNLTSIGQPVIVNGQQSAMPQFESTGEPVKKRQIRLIKNREAARECRRKKKEYVKCLELRVSVLEEQNKTLMEELKNLKDVYCQKQYEEAIHQQR